MKKIDALFAGLALTGLLLLPLGFAFAASRADTRGGFLFETELTAGEETHDATPAVATGHAGAWFGPNGEFFNYWLSAFSEEPLTGAHFHCAPRGEDGPIVVHLENTSGTSTPNGELTHGSRAFIGGVTPRPSLWRVTLHWPACPARRRGSTS